MRSEVKEGTVSSSYTIRTSSLVEVVLNDILYGVEYAVLRDLFGGIDGQLETERACVGGGEVAVHGLVPSSMPLMECHDVHLMAPVLSGRGNALSSPHEVDELPPLLRRELLKRCPEVENVRGRCRVSAAVSRVFLFSCSSVRGEKRLGYRIRALRRLISTCLSPQMRSSISLGLNRTRRNRGIIEVIPATMALVCALNSCSRYFITKSMYACRFSHLE